MTFRQDIINPAVQPTPKWLRRDLGARLLYVLGAAHDAFAEYVYEGVSARFPSLAEPMALQALGRDRGIPIYPGEPLPSQRIRLRQWRKARRLKGTAAGAMKVLQPIWYPAVPTMRVVAGNSTRAMWATLYGDDAVAQTAGATSGTMAFHRASPTNWDWDSDYAYRPEPATIHRWWAIVYAPPQVVEHPALVPPSTTISVGSSLLTQFCNDVQFGLHEWRRAGSKISGWILAFDPTTFDPAGSGAGYPDGTWHHEADPVTRLPNRVTTARYHRLFARTPE